MEAGLPKQTEKAKLVSESETVTECEGQVLSDVHVHCIGHPVHVNHEEFSETRFSFKQPWSFIHGRGDGASVSRQNGEAALTIDKDDPVLKSEGTDQTCNTCETDEDGDLLVKRRRTENDSPELVITIAHAMATDLSLVGQQDKGNDILHLALHNAERNSHLHQNSDIRVRELDWTAETPFTVESDASDPTKLFHLSKDDVETLRACSVILAAEVVYDLELTDAFFCTVYHLLMSGPAKSVYMTVEKRQVFTVADRDVVSPAYEHFRENLQDLCSIDEGPVRFLCSQIDLSFPQYFYYQRIKELELWKIEAVFVYQPLGIAS